MTDIVLISLRKTSEGCPSRWIGTTSDGEFFSAIYDRGAWTVFAFFEGKRRKIGSGRVTEDIRSRTCSFGELRSWAKESGVNIYNNPMEALAQSQGV